MNTFLFTSLYIHLHIYRNPWDVWSRPQLLLQAKVASVPLLTVFLFFCIFIKQLPPTEMALLPWLCSYRFAVQPSTHPAGSRQSGRKIWEIRNDEAFRLRREWKWTCVAIKEGQWRRLFCGLCHVKHVSMLNWWRVSAHTALQLKEIGFLALQINKEISKNNLPKNKGDKHVYGLMLFSLKAQYFYNKNINNIMDFFRIWLWYIFKYHCVWTNMIFT